ncbi:MAG: peptidyl-prolyl cis-trans isomerase [Acidobacteriota bacterium]|nr:peptidyl-prolyl cis-trans isomerase [Acidobacteriota bacterium]
MNKKSVTLKYVFIIFSFAVGLAASSACNQNAKTPNAQQNTTQSAAILTSLSADDVAAVIKTLPPQSQQMIAGSPEQIKEFLDDLQKLLAVAAEARKNGLADDAGNKQQLDFIASTVLATAFDQQTRGQGGAPFADITPEQVAAFYQNPENEAKFNAFLDLVKQRGAEEGGAAGRTDFTEEELKRARETWAKITITAEKARAAGLDQKRETQLQIAIQQAQFLAQQYARKSDANLTASDVEIAEYVKQHPELDSSKIKEKAEQVLARAKAGEDFGKLAKEFSEDPGSKDKGGLYENVKKGQMVPEFEKAALALENGKVAENLVESNYGYHIIKLENKSGETYNVRHILLMTSAPAGGANPYAPPASMADKARDGVKTQKRDQWIEEVVARNPISLPRPEDVKVEVPPAPAPMQPQAEPKQEAPADDKKSKK